MVYGTDIEEAPKHHRVSYNEKPFAVRVKQPAGPSKEKPSRIGLTHLNIGGSPVVYNEETRKMEFGGESFDVWQWLELRHRLDLVYIRDRVLEKVSPPRGNWDGTSSHFLTRNFRAISKQLVGTMKRAPWWLRWRYSSVITKESHGYSN